MNPESTIIILGPDAVTISRAVESILHRIINRGTNFTLLSFASENKVGEFVDEACREKLIAGGHELYSSVLESKKWDLVVNSIMIQDNGAPTEIRGRVFIAPAVWVNCKTIDYNIVSKTGTIIVSSVESAKIN